MSSPGTVLSVIGAVLLRYNGDPAGLARAVQVLVDDPRLLDDVLLVDNASTLDPEAIDRIAEQYVHVLNLDGQPLVRCLHQPRNGGFAAGNNAGIAALRTSCTQVLIHNDDAVLEVGSLRLMADQLSAAPKTVVSVGPLILMEDDRAAESGVSIIDAAGIAVNDRAEGRNLGLGQPDLGQYGHHPVRSFGPCFALALIRRDAFDCDQVGPLVESYFMYYEDVEWNWRAQRLGRTSLLVPAARARHRMSSSSRANGGDVRSAAGVDPIALTQIAESAYATKHRRIERNLLLTGATHLPVNAAVGLWLHRWPRLMKAGLTGRFPKASVLAALDAAVGLPKALRRRVAVSRRSKMLGNQPRSLRDPLQFWDPTRIFFDPVTYETQTTWDALSAAARTAGAPTTAMAADRRDVDATRAAGAFELPDATPAIEGYLRLLASEVGAASG